MSEFEIALPSNQDTDIDVTNQGLYNYNFNSYSLATLQKAAGLSLSEKIRKSVFSHISEAKLIEELSNKGEVEYVAKMSDYAKEKLKSGFWKIFGVRYLSVPKKPVHNLDISAVFEDDPTTIPARKDILGEAINTLNEKVKEIVDARDYLQWKIDNYDSHMIESENKL